MIDVAQKLPPRTGKSYYWLLPIVLLGSMVGGLLVMLAIARDDPAFAVEEDYYKKAISWDAHRAQLARNERLGWALQCATSSDAGRVIVTVQLRDAGGEPITGAKVALEAFHNARAADLIDRQLTETRRGTYSADIGAVRSGLWELRFSAERDGKRFTNVVRQDILGGGQP